MAVNLARLLDLRRRHLVNIARLLDLRRRYLASPLD